MAKADGLKHGRPQEALATMCHCECSRMQHCPITEEDSTYWQNCKASYKQALKEARDGKG